MPYAAVNDIRMYYEEQGAGVPLVLLHGALGAIDDPASGWGDLMPRFAERYRAIHLEHRGHGRTDNPADRLTYAMVAADVAAFLERLALAPVHLAGVSDGAIVALHLGMTRPELVRTLVCVGANYVNDASVDQANAGPDADTLERDHPEWASDLARGHDRGKAPGWWKTLYRQILDNVAVNPAYTEADLRRISTPTLLIAGEDDPYANLDQMVGMKRNIAGAEMLILNNAGHVVQFTHPQVIGPAVLDFFDRHSAPA